MDDSLIGWILTCSLELALDASHGKEYMLIVA